MEWPIDFQCPPLEESLLDALLSSPQLATEQNSTEWTIEENKLFENALAEIAPNSPAFLENVASRVPWKSMEDVKNHYQALLDDIETIELGKLSLPIYTNLNVENNQAVTVLHQDDHPKKDEGSTSSADSKISSNVHQRRRGVPWTEEEHQLFLMGLNKYGKGDWRNISRYYVITKTATQVASHAQKYFRRQTSSTPVDRRRPSIHDIHTVTPTPTPFTQRPTTLDVDPLLPNFQSCGVILPHFNSGMINVNDPLAPDPMFIPPMNNLVMNNNLTMNSNLGDHIFNQNADVPANAGVAAYPSAAFMLPSMMNKQWD
ncbi:hypothetical protein ACS0TY_008722 [Phlomoides rotata]